MKQFILWEKGSVPKLLKLSTTFHISTSEKIQIIKHIKKTWLVAKSLWFFLYFNPLTKLNFLKVQKIPLVSGIYVTILSCPLL